MTRRRTPHQLAISVKRLVLHGGNGAPRELGESIAASVALRLRGEPSATNFGLAEAIAQGIAERPELASLVGEGTST